MTDRPGRPARFVNLYSAIAARAGALTSRRVSRARDSGIPEPEPQTAERRGRPTVARPQGLLLWLHASDENEAQAAVWMLPRLSRAMGETVSLLVTTTRTGAGVFDQPFEVFHQAVPNDTRASVISFLDHWRPDASIVVGGDYRPVLLSEADRRDIGMVSINSTVRHDAAPLRIQQALVAACAPLFRLIHESDGSVSQALGKEERVSVQLLRGEAFMEGCVVPEANDSDRDALSSLVTTRPIWLAAGITSGEVGPIMLAQAGITKHTHRALLIASTDDTEVADALAAQSQKRGWSVARRSLGDEPEQHVQLFVADVPGEEGLWYRLASVSFLGNSLSTPGGGISPLPAAALGSVVLHGPHVGTSMNRYDRLAQAGAARLVLTGEGLSREVQTFFQPDVAAKSAQAAWNELSLGAREADRVIEVLCEILEAGEGL